MDDVTEALPDIVDFVEKTVTEPCIIDGEVVAVDEDVVTVDFDPERSGQSLTFDVEVIDVE